MQPQPKICRCSTQAPRFAAASPHAASTDLPACTAVDWRGAADSPRSLTRVQEDRDQRVIHAQYIMQVQVEVVAVAPEGIHMERDGISEAAAQMLAESTYVNPFAAPLESMCKEDASLVEIAEAFAVFDKDGNKRISLEEFKDGITKLKLEHPKGAVDGWKDAAFDRFDVRNDGEIRFDEFCFAIGMTVMAAKARGEQKTAMECFQSVLVEGGEAQKGPKAEIPQQAEETSPSQAEIEEAATEECSHLCVLMICPCAIVPDCGPDLPALGTAVQGGAPTLSGLPAVVKYVGDCKAQHPRYHWSIQNYHKVRHQTTRLDGPKGIESYDERVNTEHVKFSGVLISRDTSGDFVPNTSRRVCALSSELDVSIDFPEYWTAKEYFFTMNTKDEYQDKCSYITLPGMNKAMRCEWVDGVQDPWWASLFMRNVSALTCTAACWYQAMKSHMGSQTVVFNKSVVGFASDSMPILKGAE